ncbi:G5 domain-containing protein [Georgenia wangjunii]|uniref:aggregation-promoting factor C-terminal-like domain-containing protein n=1 Tax=Georgenia wangjunii TaxID=3117730 RepID=UPI002F2698D2
MVRRTVHALVLVAVVGGTATFTSAQAGNAQLLSTDEASALPRHSTAALASRFEARAPLAELRSVRVLVDDETHELQTSAARVHEVLAEAGIVVGADDHVSVPLGDPVEDGMTVTITRVVTSEVQETTTDPFTTVEQEDPNLPEGERAILTEGVDGVETVTYRVRTAGDEELDRELLARVVVSERVDEVVVIGTAEAPVLVEAAPQPPEQTQAQAQASEPAVATAAPVVPAYEGDPRALGAELAAARGWSGEQFSCLDRLWQRESNWNPTAQNPSSGAYGIPQSLPASKMASVGADWRTNPATQIRWGLDYIGGRYGTPCGAWAHSERVGWY